jgi:hypothetical protein
VIVGTYAPAYAGQQAPTSSINRTDVAQYQARTVDHSVGCAGSVDPGFSQFQPPYAAFPGTLRASKRGRAIEPSGAAGKLDSVQREERDLAFGFGLIIIKERHYLGLRVEEPLAFRT